MINRSLWVWTIVLCLHLTVVQAYVPSPIFSATFSEDPTVSENRSYSWVLYDEQDSPSEQEIHSGLLVLDASTNVTYFNLTASEGPNSIAYVLQDIGGIGRGSTKRQTAGWTFELTYKAWTAQPWAKMFDLGNGPSAQSLGQAGSNEITLGWIEVNHYLEFIVCDTIDSSEYGAFGEGPISLMQWHHAVAVYYILNESSPWTTVYSMFLDGVPVTNRTSYFYPTLLPRRNATLGRSAWPNDPLWSGEIDTFNVYDVAVNAAQVQSMYNAAMSPSQVARKKKDWNWLE